MRRRTALLTTFSYLACLSVGSGGESADVIPELADILSGPEAVVAVSAFDLPVSSFRTPAPENVRDNLYPEIRVKVTSPRHTILSSQAAGKIDSLVVRDGMTFTENQVLLTMDPTFERIQCDKARAHLERQQLLYEMTRDLVELGTRGEVELEIIGADIRQAEADLAYSEARLERMEIKAPFPGRAGPVYVRELQVVAEGQPLFEIIDESAMELEFIVSSSWLRWFTPGTPFEVRIEELDKRYQAVLERLGGSVDPLSKSVNAYARLVDADGQLMEGMSGEAYIVEAER